jgi:hypothetical protein
MSGRILEKTNNYKARANYCRRGLLLIFLAKNGRLNAD